MQPTAQQVGERWTILSLITWAAQYLGDRGFEDARLNVELLLCNVLRLTRVGLYTNFDRPLHAEELAAFKAAFRRRLAHEPLQYITGEADFLGIPLFVNRSVLIPRPETEEVVQKAIAWIRNHETRQIAVLDIGTGSGNIPIAIEHFTEKSVITSIDVSQEALQVAAGNIARHECSRITLLHQDVFDDFLPEKRWDVIIANPPYISAGEFPSLQPEVRDFEPSIATTDNADGLTFIRRICFLAAARLTEQGVLFMEVAYNQGEAAQRIAREAGLAEVHVSRDMSGNERMLHGRRAA
jgi:release factor glutamine methyltransferase